LVGVVLIRALANLDLAILGVWPDGLPLAVQVILMLLVAELGRYWLHVAAHNTGLWRLHAVHHSVQKLYWLNVGRFHPLEKGLQFLFDALPFIVLGVGEEVLALYFVFYAVNGFFQHSNVDARYGVLNYVISSGELHRWHHSKLIEESNHNYGNNLIVWDLLFGTWYLPKDRRVGELGLLNRRYPMSFLEQLKAPLKAGLDKEGSSGPT
jgi:sterol desaturase/sphingolipid hydroxylase (fatty acid hydroxylase superfamily)